MHTKNKAYLVGAGPGDFGLLTVRAKELIESADILIYDNLVNEKIVGLCPLRCEKIYVGKSGASHTLEQEDINRLLVEKARTGKKVVRLKGGDPFIFGRGGEEALELFNSGIEFEIVNGVSSAYAAPAYAGIPVTNRGLAATVAFITGHEDPTKDNSDIHWDKLATAVQTLVFLMGVKNLPAIVKELTAHGRDINTPVAVIERGTYPGQRTVTGTLTNIHERVTAAGIRPPSVIVVGEVVSLREKINWFEKRPLFGKTVIVTRAREQASEVVARLSGLGASVIEMPSIKIAPPDDAAPIKKAIETIQKYDWIVFTSVNGVTYFFKYLEEMGFDARRLAGIKICAIGSVTADRLAGAGIKADLVPERFVSDHIITSLDKINEISGKSFLLPRTDIAPEYLHIALMDHGAEKADNITVYKTEEETLERDSPLIDVLVNGNFELVTFTSSSTARNFARMLEQAGVKITEKIKCLSIGPVTTETAEGLGFTVVATAEEHTIEGLIDAVLDYFS